MEIKSKAYMNVQKVQNKEESKVRREEVKVESSVKLQNLNSEDTVNIKDNIENETVFKGEDDVVELRGKNQEEKANKIREAVEILNKLLHKRGSKVEIENHDFFKNDRMIKIIDEKTGDVLVEVPPKKILDMIANLVKMAEGVVLDKKV